MAKFIFTVQGEGKGHLSQAIALKQILEKKGHTIVGITLGISNNRRIPEYFRNEFSKITTLASPGIIYGKGKSVKTIKTALQGVIGILKYKKSTLKLGKLIKNKKPDYIINFYEYTTGLFYLLNKSEVPCISIGHQVLLLNKNFIPLPTNKLEQYFLNFYTRLVTYGSKKYLGLSFYPLENDDESEIISIPPLIRNEIKELKPSKKGGILMYITHPNYYLDIIQWQKKNPSVKIDVFWDNPEFPLKTEINENLFFHQVDSKKFIQYLKDCKGLCCTAGFESIAEAMYLDKPVMVIPIQNHIEQKINAWDTFNAGAGIASKNIDLDKFIQYINNHISISETFKEWQNQLEEILVEELRIDNNISFEISSFDFKENKVLSPLEK
ncbi:MAG: hypothetical protein RIR51_1482 [Bacteroidota bacterium]|jgi:uncharacterized protein (TIGR00661 family)